MPLRIGELLLEAGVVSPDQLSQALRAQKEQPGKRVGALLVEQGIVTETQLTQALSRQLAVPWVSLWHVDFSRRLLSLVPRDLAEEHCLIPVYVRMVPRQGNTLYVAMSDPTNEDGIRRVAQGAGLPVRPMIASPSDIRSAIRAYYGGEEEDEEEQAPPEESRALAGALPVEPLADDEEPVVDVVEPPIPEQPPTRDDLPAARPDEPAGEAGSPAMEQEPAEVTAPAPSAAAAAAAPAPAPAPASVPKPRAKAGWKGGKPISLTLLDGTTLRFPVGGGGGSQRPEEEPEVMTTSDLVAALRAIAHGASADEILPDARWEPLLAALLSLLLRKHLIADWEFVEELKKG